MNKYELALVVSAKIEDDARTAVVEKAKEYITRAGGTVTEVEEAGKKRLAYEIQHMTEAFYYFIQFDAEGTVPAEIEQDVRIMDNVLRFLCVRKDEAEYKKIGDCIMNKVILMGRLTRDAEIRYAQGDNSLAIARFSLAVDRRYSKNAEEQSTDFINCVAFGKIAEFFERFGRKGTKFVVEGRIQTGSYTNKDGQKVYTTDVVVENAEFAESKSAASGNAGGFAPADRPAPSQAAGDGFMDIPDGIDEELPFN